jgi:hypothetical protein
MRAGYLLIGVGLALVKWPLLPRLARCRSLRGGDVVPPDRDVVPGLPRSALPDQAAALLLFESAWKLLWLTLVALPKAMADDLDAATTKTVFSCSLGVVLLAVVPLRYVWRTYVRAPGDRWR